MANVPFQLTQVLPLHICPPLMIKLEGVPKQGNPITPLSKGGGSIGGILSAHQIKFMGMNLTLVHFIQWKSHLIVIGMPVTKVPTWLVENSTVGILI